MVPPEADMVAKISISLPDVLLCELDAEAREAGISRSELIKEATASYLGKTAEERRAERRRAAGERAMKLAAELRARPIRDTRPTLDILREIRETEDSAPMPCDE
jgi:Arc/MetJ-type ribon-helix-helix transcriptional regulator